MTKLPDAKQLPLRELLICLVAHEKRVVGVLVRREGMRFEAVATLIDDDAALLSDKRTLEILEGMFELPVRVLDPDNSVFLGRQTFLAQREGRVFYRLKVPKLPLAP